MDIYFLRHASAGDLKLPGEEDEKRPLDDKGKEQSRDVGRLLARLGVEPDVFVSSPLTRARQTAELVAKELDYADEIVLDDALRPGATYDQFKEFLAARADRKSMIVTGHNPTLSEFLSLLISREEVDDAIDLKKGAVAKVESGTRPQLAWCITPKIVSAAYEVEREHQ